ncbi:MAG: lytic transglycosylase domain-containing protein [Rhizobiaceae bacterium]|nr:lytic transglycosylase domain-containing protein [Rhizobiaceae bacterium]
MLAAAGIALLLTAPVVAEVLLPGDAAPVPALRPDSYAPALDPSSTGSVRALSAATADAGSTRDVARLKTGLDALAKGDLASARRVRETLSERSLDHEILSWAIALGGGDATSREIASAMSELGSWPGQRALRRNLERAVAKEKLSPDAVVRTLGSSAPLTFDGAVALGRAQLARGDKQAARAAIAPFWRKEKLEPAEESAVMREFGGVLSKADHRARMEQMLHVDRVNSALRVAKAAGAEKLADAWGAVIRKERNAGKLLDAVPRGERDAGWVFAKARHLRWAGKYKDAAEVMLRAPTDAASLVDPDAWWTERRVLSRELLDMGDVKTAYRLAAAHAAESPSMQVDAEFHAGWYALRGMRDAKTAARHFQKIAQIAEGAISLSRAYYWMGRAAQEGAGGDARAQYQRAAHYGTTFYGQLAAAKLGRNTISAEYPSPSQGDRLAFENRRAVQAIRRLEAAGHQSRAGMLYADLARELTSTGELALLAVMAEKRGDHHTALRVGKIAASRGLDVGALSHPLGAIPGTAKVSGAGKALAYAIARQESEFNTGAVSSAGARGLLQLLPGTAKDMAKTAGLSYSAQKLVTDPGYNATLGAAYLSDQLGRFDGSYVLTFAGYNAGPSRAVEWVKRYGDPRGKDVDAIVDWIERIPYTETRNYVQRVMENYQVYKMRLSGRVDVTADLVSGRRG